MSSLSVNSPKYYIQQNAKSKKIQEQYITKNVSSIKTNTSKDVSIKREIEQLEQREDMIIAHENMHMQVGGSLASAPSYIYETGPDGKKYVSGGTVNMKLPSSGSLEKKMNDLKTISKAASAVSNPSGADIKTASIASALYKSIKDELAVMKMKKSYNKIKKTELELDNKKNTEDGKPEKKINNYDFKVMSKFELLI